MVQDPYANFAERYDLSFGPFGASDSQVVEFFRRLFTANDTHTVLDCACGTGRHLPLFQSLGCQVCGSDVSEAMLAQARKNLAAVGADIPLAQADFRDLPRRFRQPFDAVVCLAAIGFMPDQAQVLKAFQSMHQVLREGGLVVLTAMPTDRQWKEKPRFILNTNRRDFSRLFVVDYMEHSARYNILDIFHDDARSDLQVWSAQLYALLQDTLERLLASAGFRSVEFYGSFDAVPYDKETSDSLIVVARK